jgi:recombinational DNA repair protein RecT
MSDNLVKLTISLIQSQPDVKSLLELPQVKNAWVTSYEKVTGRTDGHLKFENEKILLLRQISQSSGLANADKFSIYAAFIELAISGLSLLDGISYIIPYKGKAQWQPGWKGRLEQLAQMDGVIHCNEPICIYEGEEYKISAGENLHIDHTPRLGNEGKNIMAVYLTIRFVHGNVFYMMSREEVLKIRDNYSEPYKSYKKKMAEGKWESWMDAPMWVSSEAQAFKKTLIIRVYNSLPKLASQKYLDEKVLERMRIDVDEAGSAKAATMLAEEQMIKDVVNDALQLDPEDEQPGATVTQPEAAPVVAEQPAPAATTPPPAPLMPNTLFDAAGPAIVPTPAPVIAPQTTQAPAPQTQTASQVVNETVKAAPLDLMAGLD